MKKLSRRLASPPPLPANPPHKVRHEQDAYAKAAPWVQTLKLRGYRLVQQLLPMSLMVEVRARSAPALSLRGSGGERAREGDPTARASVGTQAQALRLPRSPRLVARCSSTRRSRPT